MSSNINLTDQENLPRHIAIIMDGNGRWARKHRLPKIMGHKEGVKSVREIVESCAESGISFLTLYAFSTENWARPRNEVNALMRLLQATIKSEAKKLHRNNVRFRAIGRLNELPEYIQKAIEQVTQLTAANTGLNLIMAVNYGGRQEIVDAVKQMARTGVRPEDINETRINEHLYTAGIPDPDLLIRTSGEYRISNFLIWQISYTELYTTEVLWPDFRKKHLQDAIIDYQKRERRFGR